MRKATVQLPQPYTCSTSFCVCAIHKSQQVVSLEEKVILLINKCLLIQLIIIIGQFLSNYVSMHMVHVCRCHDS